MATPRRRKNTDLRTLSPVDDLLGRPERFSFFQAVRLLEREAARRAEDSRNDSLRPVGEDHDPRREAVRFRSAIQLNFPAAEVQDAERTSTGARTTLTVGFFGLTGALGALPDSYSDLVQRSVRQKNNGLREFFDLFNSRLLGLFYRAWTKYRLPVSYERGRGAGREDPITQLLYALVGFGTAQLRGRSAAPDSLFTYFGGILARRPRPAIALEDVFSGALGHTVRIEQFCGEWQALATDERTRLPDRRRSQGQFCRLGVDAVAGERVWELQGGFRLHIGPLSYAEFAELLPNAPRARLLSDLVQLAAGSEFAFAYRLTLRPGEGPPLRLGDKEAWLSWNMWLPTSGTARLEKSVTFRSRIGGTKFGLGAA
jgi:type VI secretion system protein ImpH